MHRVGMKKGLRIVDYESGSAKDRKGIYRSGGVIGITSRILVVDMLQSQSRDESHEEDVIPMTRITGIVILHAHLITPSHPIAFIVRLYREQNTDGFIKAFSDQPERMTSGLNPLRGVMKELGLRSVAIWPRFHENVKDVLDTKGGIIELNIGLTESMKEIHQAIVHCMTLTLQELAKSKTDVCFFLVAYWIC